MKMWIPNIVSAVICCTLLSSCSDKAKSKVDANAGVITVGAVLPFSGGLENFGEQAKAGIKLAVEEVNESGGIDGKKLEVLYEDNETNADISVQKTKALMAKKPVAIIGPITSNARDAMTPILEKQKVPLLYATNYEGGVCSDYVYSFNTVPNQELAQLIPEVAGRKGTSFYLFGTDYVWPQKMFMQAEKEIAKFDGKIAGKTFTSWGKEDYTDEIREIMASDAKTLLFAVPGVDGTNFIKQAHKLGLTKKMTIAFLGFSETYIPEMGDTSGMDILVTVPFISTAKDSQEFVANIEKTSKDITGVSHYARTHYDAIKSLASALEKTKNHTSAGATKGLKKLVNDNIEINQDNQANLNMYVGKLENNKLQEIKSFGIINGEVGCEK